MDTYKIVRMYYTSATREIENGLTLEEAQAHCNNPESSSNTATSPDREPGIWFDGYALE